MKGRILALDVGRRRIGLAISDPLGATAQGLTTLTRTRMRDDLRALQRVAAEKEVGLFLLGLPLHLSGDEGRQAEFVREFGDKLNRETDVAVEYIDERLTTVEANRVLRESGISLEKRTRAVDQLSAVLLLEAYLARREYLAREEGKAGTTES